MHWESRPSVLVITMGIVMPEVVTFDAEVPGFGKMMLLLIDWLGMCCTRLTWYWRRMA